MSTTELRKSPSGKEVELQNLPAGDDVGDLLYWNGSAWVTLSTPSTGSLLLFDSPSSLPLWGEGNAPGNFIYYDGLDWQLLSPPSEPSLLSVNGDGVPSWLPNNGRPVPTAASGSFSVTASSFNLYYRVTSGSPTTITVQQISSANWQPGAVVLVKQMSTGLITFVAAGGVTINLPFDGSLVSAGTGAVLSLIASQNVDEWDLGGQTAAPP